MMPQLLPTLLLLTSMALSTNAYSAMVNPLRMGTIRPAYARLSPLRMSEPTPESSTEEAAPTLSEPESAMDAAMRAQSEQMKKVEELKAQEVFIKRGTGIYECINCGWEFDQAKGDVMMIGGQVQPGTEFGTLPTNWRCPTCRASKDSFTEQFDEIPGFEVNQGYGFGTNSWTSGQKTGVVFGGLFAFFVLFIGGYAMS